MSFGFVHAQKPTNPGDIDVRRLHAVVTFRIRGRIRITARIRVWIRVRV